MPGRADPERHGDEQALHHADRIWHVGSTGRFPGHLSEISDTPTRNTRCLRFFTSAPRSFVDSDGMKIGIVGLGYVGLPLAVAFAEAGDDVVGVDQSTAKVERLRRSDSDVEDVSSERLRSLAPRFTATDDYRALAGCEAILICVPTPLTEHREPDLSYLVSAASGLSRVLHEGRLVVVESTTYPGTTRERVAPILEESGLAAGRDFNLAYSPERIDPGRSGDSIRETPKVVGGLTEACSERAVSLYGRICDQVVPVSIGVHAARHLAWYVSYQVTGEPRSRG